MADGRSIHAGSVFTVERRTPSDQDTIVLKYPTSAIPATSALNRLEREYEVGTTLNLPSVRKVIGRCEWQGRPALELEYVPGDTFKTYFADPQHRHIEIVLRLALSALNAIEAMHAAGVVHRDIAATNLLVREGSKEAILIDLEFATRGGDDDFVFAVVGQLPYLSPEQTGRIDLPVDERSDLYSFGVILYEMLTGELPFQAEDSAGWIHAHLARRPDPPMMREPTIPLILSDIVMRLLAKPPENRYQTARGLHRDLRHCLEELHSSGNITSFALGHGDHSGRLHFPAALYGREKEQQLLNSALQQAITGQPSLQCISGFAGAGKTALVNELRFPVAAVGGRFISGKFDQTIRALPYAALAEAFTQLCHQLLAGTPEELETFRSRVLEALGANAGLLIEFVPILEEVIGLQPSPPPLETTESANRFAVTLLGFFHSLVAAEHPLVLFLDDVQWADTASLDLLYMIATRSVRSHFLILCAYRDNEIAPDHPLLEHIDRVRKEWPHVGHIALGGLSLEQTTTLTGDALDTTVEQATPLATMLYAKTDGNPFFLRQVLETLVSEEVLHFDPHSDSWHWETERVNALDISDNVIELMLRKIARLPGKTQAVLQAAACIGNTFALKLLAAGTEFDRDRLRELLSPAVDAGLVVILGSSARFTHDRIQQAVYQSLAENTAQRIHLRLGRYLLQQHQPHELPLLAAQQLNLGQPLIDSTEEKQRLAALNLEAGDTARTTMAYASARDFYSTGESLLSDAEPATTSLLFELRLHKAETLFYLGEVASAVQQLKQLLLSAPDMTASTYIYQLLIDIHTVELELTEALNTLVRPRWPNWTSRFPRNPHLNSYKRV